MPKRKLHLRGSKGGKGGGGTPTRPPVEDPNTLQSKSIAKVVDLLCEGKIKGLANGAKSIFFNETPLEDSGGNPLFDGINWDIRLGEPDQTHLPGFDDVEAEVLVNTEVLQATPIVRTTSEPNIDAVRFTIRIPSLTQQDIDDGDLHGTTVNYKLFKKATSDGDFVLLKDRTLTGKNTSPYQESWRFELTGTAPFDLKVERVTADSGSVTLNNKTFWDSFTEIIESKVQYVDSAVIGLEVDSELFGGQVPTRGYELEGLEIQVPSNYDPVNRTYSPTIWDGTFTTAYSNNPAWCFYDLLTNDRYGLGEVVNPSRLDKFTFYEIGQYCDGPVDKGFVEVFAAADVQQNDVDVGFTTYTTEFNETATADDVIPFPATEAIGDQFLVAYPERYRKVNFNITTPGVGGSVTFKYWDGTNFSALSNVNDTTTNFTAGGNLSVTFDVPTDWVPRQIGNNTTTDLFYILAEVDTVYTTNPLIGDGTIGLIQEPRFSFNAYLGTREDVFTAIGALASAFRAMVYWASGTVHVVQDAPRQPDMIVNPANVIGGNFVYSGGSLKARHTAVMVTWNDPDDGYKTAVEVVEDPEAINKYGFNSTDIYAVGTTSRGQAHRLGEWLLYTEQNETETITYKAGLDHAHLLPGMILEVHDPDHFGSRFGGRIVSATDTTATLDSSVTLETGEIYTISVLTPDGSIVSGTITDAPGAYTTVTVSQAWSTRPDPQALWVIDSDLALQVRQFRIISIAEEDPGQFNITALLHDPNKFAVVEQDLVLDVIQRTDFATGEVTPVLNVTVTESLFLVGSIVHNRITVGWDATTDERVTSYQVSYRRLDDNWVVAGNTGINNFDIHDLVPDTYDFRVIAQSAIGPSIPTDLLAQSIQGKTALPLDVTGFTVTPGDDGNVNFTWNHVTDLDVIHGGGYRIKYEAGATFNNWGTATLVNEGIISSSPFIADAISLTTGVYSFAIKAVDSSDNESETEDTVLNVTINSPADIDAPQSVVLTSGDAELYIKDDGTAVSRMKVAWVDPTHPSALEIRVQIRKGAGAWEPSLSVDLGTQQVYIWDVEDGATYDARLRTAAQRGYFSTWTEELGHVVQGKSAPPSDVTGFAVTPELTGFINFDWNEVADRDVVAGGGYKIKYQAGSSIVWSTATALNKQVLTFAPQRIGFAQADGTYSFAIKAIDSSGNESLNDDQVTALAVYNPANIDAPSNLFLASGDAHLYTKKDGTIVSRILVTWIDPTHPSVESISVQFSRSGSGSWETAGIVEPTIEQIYIWDVEEGVNYDVRIRSNAIGGEYTSAWVTATNHLVEGKTSAPANVTGFTVTAQTDGFLKFTWNEVADTDVKKGGGYQIRYELGATITWNTATNLHDGNITSSPFLIDFPLGDANYSFAIKAVNTSDIQSVTEATQLNIATTHPSNVDAPTGLTLTSGDTTAYVKTDGTVVSRILVEWTDPTQACAVAIGVQAQRPAGSWEPVGTTELGTQNTYIWDAEDGVAYNVRIRTRAERDFVSTWVSELNHVVVGKTTPPPDPGSLLANTLPDGTREYRWTMPSKPADLAGYQLRYEAGTGHTWAQLTGQLSDEGTGLVSGSPYESSQLNAGTYVFGVAAVDTSGNVSSTPILTTATLGTPPIEGSFAQVDLLRDGWTGVKTNCFVGSPTGWLVGDASGSTWAAMGTWDTNTWIIGTVASWEYKHEDGVGDALIDIGFDATFTPLLSLTTENANVTITYKYKTGAGAYQGTWQTVTEPITAQFIRIRIEVAVPDTAEASVIKQGIFIAAGEPVEEAITDLDTSTISAPAGDLRLPIQETYGIITSVQVALQNVGAGWSWELIDKNNTLGPRIKIYNASDTLADATIDAFIRGL